MGVGVLDLGQDGVDGLGLGRRGLLGRLLVGLGAGDWGLGR